MHNMVIEDEGLTNLEGFFVHELVIKMCNGLMLHSYIEPTKELENHNIHFSF